MGAFNFIESFFLLSLGITFVLIVLLVYHFKQRLSSMEQKCDTMFDIVQNLVKELKAVKTACQEQSGGVIDPLMSQFVTHKDIMVDEDDSDDSDDDEDDDEDEDDDDDDDATAVDSVKIINMDIGSKIDIIEIKSDSDSEEAAIELDVEEPVPTIHKIESTSVDYKKLTVAELKQIVSSQGLTTNAHKLTKTELLKLLEK
jgi:Na+-transporting methylmalonyl-CoA/oxaloacetate decarboxylase gamma subunit